VLGTFAIIAGASRRPRLRRGYSQPECPDRQGLLAAEIGPGFGLNEAGPVERMAPVLALENGQLGLAESFAAPQTLVRTRVVEGNQFASDIGADGPETQDEAFGPCEE
jgi:hypothetical protein